MTRISKQTPFTFKYGTGNHRRVLNSSNKNTYSAKEAAKKRPVTINSSDVPKVKEALAGLLFGLVLG